MTAALVPLGRVTRCCYHHAPAVPGMPDFDSCALWMPCCRECPARIDGQLSIEEAFARLRPGWASEDIGEALWFFDRTAWDVTVVQPNVPIVVACWRRVSRALAKEPF